MARLRSRGGDRLRLEEVARRCGLPVLAIEAFLSGAKLSPTALAVLPAILAEQSQPRPADVGKPPVVPEGKHHMLTARAIKVTLVLDPAELVALADPTTSRITLRVQVDGRVVSAEIAGKSLRKAKAAIAEHGAANVATIVQGKLVAGDVVVEAGLVAQLKAPKAATPPLP